MMTLATKEYSPREVDESSPRSTMNVDEARKGADAGDVQRK